MKQDKTLVDDFFDDVESYEDFGGHKSDENIDDEKILYADDLVDQNTELYEEFLDSSDNLDDVEFIDTGSISTYKKERISEVTGKVVKNYVDKDMFCNAVVLWNDQRKIAIENEKPIPPMPDIIGHFILKMAYGLSNRFNFKNYTYIDEMTEDAIYMATRAVKNFDPTKSNNAFGYFNRVMWQAMTNRIKTEKDEDEAKKSLLKDPMYLGYVNETDETIVNKDRLLQPYDEL